MLTRWNEETDEFQQALLLYAAGSEAAGAVRSSALYVTYKSCDAILIILEQFRFGKCKIFT